MFRLRAPSAGAATTLLPDAVIADELIEAPLRRRTGRYFAIRPPWGSQRGHDPEYGQRPQ